MPSVQESQRAKLRSLLAARSMMHAHELREAGISGQTIARAVKPLTLIVPLVTFAATCVLEVSFDSLSCGNTIDFAAKGTVAS
jgi:hypothetical protein